MMTSTEFKMQWDATEKKRLALKRAADLQLQATRPKGFQVSIEETRRWANLSYSQQLEEQQQ